MNSSTTGIFEPTKTSNVIFLQLITDLFALLTICCRRCICCSVFTVCGSVQSFAGMLFVIGLVAYPAGWGHEYISKVRISEI